MSQKKCPMIAARRGMVPCTSFCPSMRLGCCNSENSSKQCAGPVNLTAQWDIGSRPCCPGAGQKYTAMGGLLNYCSTNGGQEYPGGDRVLAPFPLTNTINFSYPINPSMPGNNGPNTFSGFYKVPIKEGYRETPTPLDGIGIA